MILSHIVFVFFILFFTQCNSNKTNPSIANTSSLLSEVPSSTSHIDFENKVIQNGENNVLNYSYYFNGGGVAILDINHDGLQDIYFTGNTVSNKLYLNKGNLSFEDITDKAGVACLQQCS